MRGSDVRAAWLRGQVLLVLLVPALVGAFGQPMSIVVALGALTLVCAAVTARARTSAAPTETTSSSVSRSGRRSWTRRGGCSPTSPTAGRG